VKDAPARIKDAPARVRDEAPRRRNASRQADDDAPVIGMGDHVPSFLLRPVRLKSVKTAE
jgi:hypothetical protein